MIDAEIDTVLAHSGYRRVKIPRGEPAHELVLGRTWTLRAKACYKTLSMRWMGRVASELTGKIQ